MGYEKVQNKLDISIPHELISVWSDEDFCLDEYNFRLLTSDEIITMHHILQEDPYSPTEQLTILPFLTDDNSNYTCIYYDGLFKDKITYYDHEDVDFSPSFSSITSFIKYLKDDPNEYIGRKQEYPIMIDTEEYYTLYTHSLKKYKQSTDFNSLIYWAFCTLNFIPLHEISIMRAFLFDTNLWIQEKACRVIEKRRDLRFITDLGKLIDLDSNRTNINIAAIRTLGVLNTDGCREILLKLSQKENLNGYDTYIRNALNR